MADRTPVPTRPFAHPLALWSAVLGLIVGTATLLAATGLSASPGDEAPEVRRIGVLLVAFTGPFLLALASLRLSSPSAQRVVWLIAGLLALVSGGMTIFSGVGFFLIAAGAGLIAAWWISR
jgi:hypothetical protein